LAERAGLPHIRLHDVRHSYATAALRAGVNPKIVSQRLGHSSLAFTLTTYSHALPGFDREAADELAELLLADPTEGFSAAAVSKSVSTRHENGPSDDL
jgi:integrase